MPSATDWITLAEAAEILEQANVRFSPATIGGWARAGKLQSIKLGGRRFVRRGEVKALVAGRRRVKAEDVQPRLVEELTGRRAAEAPPHRRSDRACPPHPHRRGAARRRRPVRRRRWRSARERFG